MSRKRAGVEVVVGGVLGYGGVFRSFESIGALRPVLLWSVVALFGLFLLLLGARRFLTDVGDPERGDPANALGKTDSRFRRR